MATASDQASTICSNCDRAIPSPNIDPHYAHCSRNFEKCKVCGDIVPRKQAEEHALSCHAHCNGPRDGTAESSRTGGRNRVPHQRQPPQRRLLFTIAITGIAVLLASFFYQRKTETDPIQ